MGFPLLAVDHAIDSCGSRRPWSHELRSPLLDRLPFVTDEPPGRRLRFESLLAARIYADAQPGAVSTYDAQTGELLEMR